MSNYSNSKMYCYQTPGIYEDNSNINGDLVDTENDLLALNLENVLFINGIIDSLHELDFRYNFVSHNNKKKSITKKQLKVFVKEIIKRTNSMNINKTILNYSIYYLTKFYTNLKTTRSLFTFCIKRIFVVSLIIANKFLIDENYKISTWSLITGLSVRDLKNMETFVLQTLDYSLTYNDTSSLVLEDNNILKKRSSQFSFISNEYTFDTIKTKKLHS